MMKIIFVQRRFKITSKNVISIGIKFLFHHKKLREIPKTYFIILVTMDSEGT